jgi:hypothetical protein
MIITAKLHDTGGYAPAPAPPIVAERALASAAGAGEFVSEAVEHMSGGIEPGAVRAITFTIEVAG